MNIFILLIFSILSALLAGYIVYKILCPRLKSTQELDIQTEIKNQEISIQNTALIENNTKLKQEAEQLKNENNSLLIQKNSTIEQINILNNNIATMEKQAQETADLFLNSKLKIAQENLEQSLEKEIKKYQDNINSFKEQYNETVLEMMEQYKTLNDNVSNMKAINDAAVEAAKRAEEIKIQQDYYRIRLTDLDIHEIELLRSVEPYLRDKEPLNKVIWKVYYEKPTTDLIGRVVGSGIHTGIYKITEIDTGKCYVGQAANIADRWKQHIKRGVGAETPTRNKLYPAMSAIGPENFTFEIIEECERKDLDSREDYWQNYFKAKEFGYSIK